MELLDHYPAMSYFIRHRPNVVRHKRRPGIHEINYKISNVFSEHDNRHSFQDHGVYFGDGRYDRTLGRKLILPDLRLHHTDNVYLKHNDRVPVNFDLNTSYAVTYQGKPTGEPPVHRRFPKRYKPPSTGPAKLETKTTDWHRSPEVPYKTAMQVMATSQEPFAKHNSWKYSYNGMRRIYPQYDRKEQPVVKNEFNKYGAAFVTGS
ncbi:uncharacterized protein LOC143073021 isoform X3 [Mytilus galloprovincialis]|uniref:uncharacterized protein LOC143073021 isoform X3 n=1 Tax=Mytilus galloprovincialis TaxID=29158 RepID=UPI003F7BD7AE